MIFNKKAWVHTFWSPYTLTLSLSNCLLEYTVFIFRSTIGFYLSAFLSPFITGLGKPKSGIYIVQFDQVTDHFSSSYYTAIILRFLGISP